MKLINIKDLNPEEKRLINFAETKIIEHCSKRKTEGLYDTILAFILSENGSLYEGIPLELPSGVGFCAERHAIANMILKETELAKVKVLLVVAPVPKSLDKPVTPCGACRLAISRFGTEKTVILCSEFIRKKKDWELFPKIWKCEFKELYPYPWKDPWSEN